jgi:isoquinoline 1-oxidoreductase beta subunit
MKYILQNQTQSSGGVTRRAVIQGAGLTLAIAGSGTMFSACSSSEAGNATLAPNQFLKIGSDSRVVLVCPQTEVGQGTYTGLATLLAEELDADWNQVSIEPAEADVKRFGNPAFGGALQGTGGSFSMAAFWEPIRNAGATARAMLVAAAADKWGVPASEITISKGIISHAGKKKNAPYGSFVAAAAKLPVPEKVTLKDPQDFVFIGKDIGRIDAREKSSGKAIFTQDIQLPDMLVAVVAYPPRFGGKVKSFDATAAKAVPNVVNVVQFKSPVREGVAVLAKDTYSAKKARDALQVEWDETDAFKLGSDAIFAQYQALAQKPGVEARKDGDFGKSLAGARRVDATYEFPFLAHASMEPMNCVIQIKADGAEVWNGEQFHTGDQNTVAAVLGLKPEQVKIHMLYAGGSFGRRGNTVGDFLVDTAAIARADGSGKPVKMIWTREDDMRAGYYRPAYLHKLTAAINGKGELTGWQQRIVGQSIMAGTFLEDPKNPVDSSSVEGVANMPYEIPNLQVELHTTKLGVPIQWWRSVGSTHTAYAVEAFLDDIARAANKDPVELRRGLLAKHPRHLAVLNLAAEKAGWGSPLPKGTARGVALHESFGTVVAQVVEVSKRDKGYKVEKVVCAVDCGIAVNPNVVTMQMESGIVYGLTAVATGDIRLVDGRVQQSNFHDYQVLRINQMPKIEVHILPSTNKPSGVGEPGTPVIGPAVASAIARLSGKALHKLPFSSTGVTIV